MTTKDNDPVPSPTPAPDDPGAATRARHAREMEDCLHEMWLKETEEGGDPNQWDAFWTAWDNGWRPSCMTPLKLLEELQAQAGATGFHRELGTWVDDSSGAAKALRLLAERGEG